MSYDLAFWQGPAPANNDEAAEEFERRASFMEDDDVEFAPPTPEMQAFITELLRRFPPLDESSDEDTNVWATGPEPGDINGDFAYLTMTYPGAERAYDLVTETARKHGLVCFDPQNESLA